MLFKKIILTVLFFALIGTAWAQDDRVQGVAESDLMARYILSDVATSCEVTSGDTVLAVARSEGNDMLVYAGSVACEGQVWIVAEDTTLIDWKNASLLDSLPTTEAQASVTPLLDEATYTAICNDAKSAETGSLSTDPPYTLFAWGVDILDQYQADSLESLDVVLCTETMPDVVGLCSYREDGDTIYVQRIRQDFIARLVSYETGDIILERQFTGGSPFTCPNRRTSAVLLGEDVSAELWLNWAYSNVQGSSVSLIYRTTVNTNRMNSRLEPSTNGEVVEILDFGDPVNLIGISRDGDWVVGFTPDMQAAWFFVDLLNIASSTHLDQLSVVDGPANEVPIPLPTGE